MCKCSSCLMGLPNCLGSSSESPLMVCMVCTRKQDYKLVDTGWRQIAYCDKCGEYAPLRERKV